MYVLCNKEFNGTFSDAAARVALDTRERIVIPGRFAPITNY